MFVYRWVLRWLDNKVGDHLTQDPETADKIDWLRCIPFMGVHVACLAVLWTGWSWIAVGMAIALYVLRMFAITGFYHRYFSHRTFKTSRPFQLLMGVAGCVSAQRDPIWWSSHHVQHHAYSDQPGDPHSPRRAGFFRSHVGWIMTYGAYYSRHEYVKKWAKFPELRFLNRFDWLPPALLATAIFGFGALLERVAPGLGTNGPQMLIWGFFISTVCLFHGTFTINSLAHQWGKRRFETDDDSRNNWLLALLTLGEGWHNNHHHYPSATRQGFYWWEVDLTYYGLLVFSWLGLIWDLRPVPEAVLERNRLDQ